MNMSAPKVPSLREYGDKHGRIPVLSEAKINEIKVLQLNAARQSSALKPRAYCFHPEAREGASAGDLTGFWR